MLVLGGLLILLLSWLIFMIRYVREEHYKRSLQEPSVVMQTNAPPR